jgi:hypothetical protein
MTYLELIITLEENGIQVDKRTIQNDIVVFTKEYCAEFEPNLKRGRERLFRYVDINNSVFSDHLSLKEKSTISKIVDKLRIHDDIPHYQWIIYILDGLINIDKYEDFGRHVEFQNNLSLNGGELFSSFLEACMNKYALGFYYHPFKADIQLKYVFPYLLKQFNDRWFLIAKDYESGRLQTYALDRIVEEGIKKVPALKYEEADWAFIDSALSNLVGISGAFNDVDDPQTPIKDVIIRIAKSRVPYIETKPILPWQEIESENNDKGTSILRLPGIRINKELEALILSYGPDMEVLSPQMLRERIKAKLEYASGRY